MRLIRWLCFPIAKRTAVPPIVIYYLIVSLVFAISMWRRGGIDYAFRFPEEVARQLPAFIAQFAIPGAVVLAFLVIPVALCWRDKAWLQIDEG